MLRRWHVPARRAEMKEEIKNALKKWQEKIRKVNATTKTFRKRAKGKG